MIYGMIRDGNERPIEGVLVEVYRRHENDPSPNQSERGTNSEPRVYACITGATGEYAFDLPSGRYEVLSSKPDWNPTSVLALVDVRKGKKTPTVIRLEVGD